MRIVYAHAIVVGRCANPKCRAVHIDFVDKEEEVVACGAIPVDEVRGFTENIKNCAYEIVTGQKDALQ